MSFLTRDSRAALSSDIASLRSTLPRPTPAPALENVARLMSSSQPLNEAQRGRVLATHVQLREENQRLRALLASTNIGVERVLARLRDGHGARKRSPSPSNASSRKRRRS